MNGIQPREAQSVALGTDENVSAGSDDVTTNSTIVNPPSKRRTMTEEESDESYLAKRLKRQVGGVGDGASETLLEVSPEAISPGLSSKSGLSSSMNSADYHQNEPGRLFMRNLAFHTSESDLRDAFSCFGDITEVRRQLQCFDLTPGQITEQLSSYFTIDTRTTPSREGQ